MSKDDNGSQDDAEPVNSEIPQAVGSAAPFERWLDRKLKTVYGSVLEEPIPDDIINLLRQKLDR